MYSLLSSRILAAFLISTSSLAQAQFIKIAHSGMELPDSAQLGSKASDWACTYDSESKLIWEVKTADKSLRDKDWTYSWFSSGKPAEAQGVASGSEKCQTPGRCDTDKFIQDVNQQGLCGAKNWRLAGIEELKSLVRCNGVRLTESEFNCAKGSPSPAIDPAFFPNSTAAWSWSATEYVDDPKLPVWYVDFENGAPSFAYKLNNGSVRAVRNGRPIANVATYDDNTKLLTLTAAKVGAQVYSAQFQNVGNYRFQLIQPQLSQYSQPYQLPEYFDDSKTIVIPVLLAFNTSFQLLLRYENGLFIIADGKAL